MRLLDGVLSVLQLIPQLQYLQGLPAQAHNMALLHLLAVHNFTGS